MTEEQMIVFNRATYGDDERAAVNESFDSLKTSGDGHFSKRCHALLQDELQVSRALLTTSCTHALEMTALLLDLQPGDEVIVPSYTFVSTANAYALRGAKLVFADIKDETLNIDPKSVERLMTKRTRAVVPVHYAGVGCDMDSLTELCDERGVAIIEDNAHGLFGKYKGRWLGTIGSFGTQSFHETKNFYCGEGGALLVNDKQYAERAEVVREKGTNRARFFRGEVDKYSWVDIGSSYLLSDINASILWPQLLDWRSIQKARADIWHAYDDELREWAERLGFRQPHVPADREQAYHMYYLRLPTVDIRTSFIDHMRASGVHTVFHYLPLHLSAFGQQYGGKVGDCPVTEEVSDTLVRLPLFKAMTSPEVARVIDAALSFEP